MRSFVLFALLCVFVVFVQTKAADEIDSDRYLHNRTQDCLAENELNISILGITKMEDLTEKSFKNLENLTEEKRGCFVACMHKKTGHIKSDGTLLENMPRPEFTKKFTTTFEDAINSCRAEKNFCKLGSCLYSVYW